MSDLILMLPPASASGGCMFLGASRVLAGVRRANRKLLVQDHHYCLFHMTLPNKQKQLNLMLAVKLVYLSQFSMDWLGIFYA